MIKFYPSQKVNKHCILKIVYIHRQKITVYLYLLKLELYNVD